MSSPDEYFDTLLRMPGSLIASGRYAVIDRVFRLAVNARLKDSRIRFSGFFSKVDYLLKHYSERMPDKSIPLAVNDLRVRLKNIGSPNARLNEEDIPHDISVLATFIGLIYDTPVPDPLRRRYPYVRKKNARRLLDNGRTLRVVVRSVDDKLITATREDSGDDCLISYMTNADGSPNASRDYLRKLLTQGTQLNLLRPRAGDDGVVYPEYIILNPDYLIDISSVAACFDDYGDSSPYTYLLNRLKPSANTEPITLGNFASQLLDEAVHGRRMSFEESYSLFVHHNALTLAACPVGPDFRENAEAQKANIQRAVESLRHEDGTTDGSGVILEPSFFSEPLGLQGRMDYLKTDYSVVVEQKSGRAGYNPNDPDTPRARTSHYVQLLLYRALLHYGGYSPQVVYSYLLYSKYLNSLLSVGNAPQLLFQALKIRNQIAWMATWLSSADNFRLLSRLTPERICPHGRGYGWQHFKRPPMESVLSAVRMAPPLERAYYYRFLRFVETEQVLSKLGNRTKAGSGFAATWNDSLQERRETGNIYDGLSMTDRRQNAGGQVDAVSFAFPESTQTDVSNFREGDIVMFYSYDPRLAGEPLATRHMVFRGTITSIAERTITIVMRNPQTDGRVLDGSVWAVEHDFMDSSSTALYRGLQAFLSAPPRRRSLLLSQRRPEIDPSVTLSGDYTNPSTSDTEFNDLVLRVKQARDFFLIIGPPGTGKTSFGMLNVLKEQLLDGHSSVLLMAYTNRAVDEICQKVSDAGIDFIRIGSMTGCAIRFRDHMLERRAEDCDSVDELQQLIHHTRVFCGTTTSVNAGISLLGLKTFDLAIVDEASQILEPQLIGLLSAQRNGECAIRKFVLIGDEKQLPAVVQQSQEESAVTDPLLLSAGITDCRMSLFERLIHTWRPDGRDNELSYMLTRQGRMHPDIADFPSRAFYDGRLRTVPLPHQQEASALPARDGMTTGGRVEFLAYGFSAEEEWTATTSDKVNMREARVIAQLVYDLWAQAPDAFDPLHTVGVIVPYRNQVATVRRAIEHIGHSHGVKGLSSITIDTVERYQGSQRDTIIYGFTVRHAYQLDFLTDSQYTDPVTRKVIDRKLNVAMTRAMRRLVLVGNTAILRRNPVFSELIDYCAGHSCLHTIE